MNALDGLPRNTLLRGLYACDGLIHFRAYLPAGLLALTGRFRDQIKAALGDDPAPLPAAEPERRPVAELGARRLEALTISAGIFTRRFSRYMDDPEFRDLLAELHGELTRRAAERKATRALAVAR